MGDSPAMTIEFLRARLLSERSVSRSARQRADQLAKRVVELEEQLRIVTIQRKKAEKAAVEVLSILETQGIGDFAEVIDSSSDQDDVPGRVKERDDTVKDDETSTGSRMDRSEVEDGLSGSEIEVSPSQGRSLSWKSRSTSPDSHEMKIENQTKQRQLRSTFGSTFGSSPMHHLGKSCRKIRRRQTGSAAKDGRENPAIPDMYRNKEGTQCVDISNCLPEISKENKDGSPEGPVPCFLEGQGQNTNVNLYANGNDKDQEMERALEQQAQLIGQYEAEENAQREWEEKYNEHHSSTLNLQKSYETERRPDRTEDINVPKEKSTKIENKVLCYDKEEKSMLENISCDKKAPAQSLSAPFDQTFHSTIPESSGSCKETTAFLNGSFAADVSTNYAQQLLQVETDGFINHHSHITELNVSKVSFQQSEFPDRISSGLKPNRKQDVGLLDDNSDHCSQNNSSLQPHVHIFLESPSMKQPSSAQSSDRFSKEEWAETQNQLHRVPPQPPNRGLGKVLEALQLAKLSLRQELNREPLSSNGVWQTTQDSQVLAIKSSDTTDIPVGCSGLFRLPTNASPQADDVSRHSYNSQALSLTRLHSDVALSANSSNSQFSSTPYLESGSRNFAARQYVDPYLHLGTEMPMSISRYSYTPTNFSTTNASSDRFPRLNTDTRGEMPTGDRYSMHGVGWIQPNVRKM